jgi:hypothetical protein
MTRPQHLVIISAGPIIMELFVWCKNDIIYLLILCYMDSKGGGASPPDPPWLALLVVRSLGLIICICVTLRLNFLRLVHVSLV